ncbi:hypothetical protein GC093_28600 [Paenibacillus sp. LMG 31456]|uniref:Uncharacterized protein n=1 Tax=Paenibacillus foliorum TaxID=2654974 RepID=A0A972H6C0_9BACL|nr:hypothetical protein [Paenibacillus foliorum]NOU97156.1 hypothetical protein [Paenibacillus foliorum]
MKAGACLRKEACSLLVKAGADVVVVKFDSKAAGLITNVIGYLVYVCHDGDGNSYYPKIEKDGQFGLTHIESKLPDAIADYFKQ